jgi:hypothetical protein
MSLKLTLERKPNYIAVAAFSGLAGLVAWNQNDNTTGTDSFFYLGVVVVCAVLAALSLIYLFKTTSELDDVEAAGVTFSKSVYYIATLVLCVYRAAIGLAVNLTTTDRLASNYGKVWLLASLFVAGLTWVNWRSYLAEKAKLVKAAEAASNPGPRRVA